MSGQNQARVAKLEALLARINARAGAPRSTLVGTAPAPAPTSAAAAPRAVEMPQRNVPVATPTPTASTPERASDDLPDLDFVESTSPSGEKRPSLRPSAMTPAVAPPASEHDDSGEFDIPSHPSTYPSRPPARAPIDLGAVPRSATPIEMEIERTPLASAVPQPPPRDEDVGLELEPLSSPTGRTAGEVVSGVASAAATAVAGVAMSVVAGIAAGVAAVTNATSSSTRHSNRPPPAEAIESVPLPPPASAPMTALADADEPFDDARVTNRPPPGNAPPVVLPPASRATLDGPGRPTEPGAGPERIAASRALPDDAAIETRGAVAPPRAATLRSLLERAIALRPKR